MKWGVWFRKHGYMSALFHTSGVITCTKLSHIHIIKTYYNDITGKPSNGQHESHSQKNQLWHNWRFIHINDNVLQYCRVHNVNKGPEIFQWIRKISFSANVNKTVHNMT